MRFVPDSGAISIDAGTTTGTLAGLLTENQDLTVVTNCLQIASALASRQTVNVVIAGGRVRGRTLSVVDDLAARFLDGFVPDVAFIAANGITVEKGLTTPLALALASLIRPRLFTPAERRNGQANWVMGASFITEGAIPFAAADPLRVIPACMVGSALTGALLLIFGATLRAPHGGVFVIRLIGNWPMYLVAIAIGTVVSAALVVALKQFTGGSDMKAATSAAA